MANQEVDKKEAEKQIRDYYTAISSEISKLLEAYQKAGIKQAPTHQVQILTEIMAELEEARKEGNSLGHSDFAQLVFSTCSTHTHDENYKSYPEVKKLSEAAVKVQTRANSKQHEGEVVCNGQVGNYHKKGVASKVLHKKGKPDLMAGLTSIVEAYGVIPNKNKAQRDAIKEAVAPTHTRRPSAGR